jgi:N-acetylglucosaminyldiphosphoundecaprenol N-acetyl-beta-D-mannosaminyltransferase
MERFFIGSIGIDNLNYNSILDNIKTVISKKEPSQIVTFNSLMYNISTKNTEFLNAVKNARFVIPDSFGIQWALKYLTGRKIERTAGIDLIYRFCELSSRNNYRVFLLGSTQEVVEKAANNIKQKYPQVYIAGTHHGYFNNDKEIIDIIKALKPDILFVGMSIPKQEIWINKNLNLLSVPVVMGVGGSFDVISGNLKRAPLWMQNLGLEWFFRFLLQPWRILRLTGLPVFIYNIFRLKTAKTI